MPEPSDGSAESEDASIPRIRLADAEDAEIAAGIYVASSNAAFARYQAPMALSEARIRRWADDLANPQHRWWLSTVGDTATGLAGIGPIRDPVADGVGELDTIAVVPAQWRRGVGRALMAVANAGLDLAGYERAVLWTWAGYAAAGGFYPATGWSRTDQLRDQGRQVCYRRSRSVPAVAIRPYRPEMQSSAREVILSGLGEHWGYVDHSLNQDLDDIGASHDVFLVAVTGADDLVGTAGILLQGAGTAQVVRMSVRKDWRRRGVGRLLLAGLADQARQRGVGRLVLETTASWTEVRAFYEANGFYFTHEEAGQFGADAYYEVRL